MISRELSLRLLDEVSIWQADGAISAQTAQLLRARYDQPGLSLAGIARALGLAGAGFCGLAVLGVPVALSGSEVAMGVAVLLLGGALFAAGLWGSRTVQRRSPITSRAALGAGGMVMASGVEVLLHASGMGWQPALFVTGLLVLPLLFLLSYRQRNGFLLTFALLSFFHWVGSAAWMANRGEYVFAVQDPRLMAAVALLVVGVGVVHELWLQERTLRLYRPYQVLGLLYLDLSLLILSIYPKTTAAPYIAALTLAAVGQIVAGARLKNRTFIGFGATFLAIDLFTRYFESFWDSLSAGSFFLAGGAALFAVGFGCDRLLAKARPA